MTTTKGLALSVACGLLVATGCGTQTPGKGAAVAERNVGGRRQPPTASINGQRAREPGVAVNDAAPITDGLSPFEVVQSAYEAANLRQYARADQYLSKSSRRISTNNDLQRYWDKWTRDGSIQALEKQAEQIRGSQAQVRLTIHYADGSESDEVSEYLVREANGWRMDYSDQ